MQKWLLLVKENRTTQNYPYTEKQELIILLPTEEWNIENTTATPLG